MTLRIVRFSIGDGVYECIVTNLPRDEFPPERIRKLYFSRWGVEISFRKLKLNKIAARWPVKVVA